VACRILDANRSFASISLRYVHSTHRWGAVRARLAPFEQALQVVPQICFVFGVSLAVHSHRRVFAHPLRGFLQPRHVDDMVDGVKDALGVLPRQLCYPFDVCVDAPPGSAGDGSPTSQLVRAALTSVVPFRRTSFPSIGDTSSFAQFSCSLTGSCFVGCPAVGQVVVKGKGPSPLRLHAPAQLATNYRSS